MAFIKTDRIEITAEQWPSVASAGTGNNSVICKSPGKLARLIDELKYGSSTHYVSDGDWSTHDLVMALVKRYGPSHLYLTTYAIRETPVRQLVLGLHDGSIKSVHMLLDYRAQVRTPEVFQLAAHSFSKIGLKALHAKVCVIETPICSISIVGSANWTTNPKIEAGVVTLDEPIAAFHKNWILKTLDNAEIFK